MNYPPAGITTVMGSSGLLRPTPLSLTSHFFHQRSSFTWSYLPQSNTSGWKCRNLHTVGMVFATGEGTSSSNISSSLPTQEWNEDGDDADSEDLQYVSQIKKVLELLRKNRDMLFNEVKLTVMIEDPRDVERRRLLGIDDENAPSRDELAAALVEVNEGRIPEDRMALRMLAEEMSQWPNLEVEVPKKKPQGQSLYAKLTDTGIDPKEAAKRLKVDWDSAAEIEDAEADDVEVPPAVGYGALYLVTAFPVIIGISVVLILFYNSLQ